MNFALDLSMIEGPIENHSTPMNRSIQGSVESFVCSTVPNTAVRRKYPLDSLNKRSIESLSYLHEFLSISNNPI